nr:IS1 family transposase [Hyella patelloides]
MTEKEEWFSSWKKSFRCQDCGCQYLENPISRAYSIEVKQLCLKMYLNGMGFRGIARVTEIDHTTIINWVKEAGESLSEEPQDSEIPKITEIDELQTFVGNKKNKL